MAITDETKFHIRDWIFICSVKRNTWWVNLIEKGFFPREGAGGGDEPAIACNAFGNVRWRKTFDEKLGILRQLLK